MIGKILLNSKVLVLHYFISVLNKSENLNFLYYLSPEGFSLIFLLLLILGHYVSLLSYNFIFMTILDFWQYFFVRVNKTQYLSTKIYQFKSFLTLEKEYKFKLVVNIFVKNIFSWRWGLEVVSLDSIIYYCLV